MGTHTLNFGDMASVSENLSVLSLLSLVNSARRTMPRYPFSGITISTTREGCA